VQALRGTRLNAWVALHAATRGAADGLGLAHEIGHLDAGALADLVVWDWAAGVVPQYRDAIAMGTLAGVPAQTLHARVFAWMMLADERNRVATYVAGRPWKAHPLGG
jgi:guanine deaminase